MADLATNIAKGRFVELAWRVKNGDPAAARFYAIPVDVGAVTDDQLRDSDDFAAMVSLGVTERTSGGWNRKTIAAADITITTDDTNNRQDVDFTTDPLWTAVTTGAVTDLIVCYASVVSPTNSQLMPVGVQDFTVTPDGSDVQGVFASAGYYRSA